MSNFKIGGSKLSRFVNGKGFYIALAFCLVAIGTAAYVAVNNSAGIKNSITAQGSSSSSIPNWDSGADSTSAQTNNTVSNVPDTRSSTASKTQSSSSKAAVSSSSSSASSAAKLVFTLPVRGNVVTAYSGNNPVYDKTMDDWRVHDGIDFAAAEGTPVKACASGKVVEVKIDDLLGQEVIIDHGNGLRSIYANLTNKVVVKKGQWVEVGDTIGAVGETALSETSIQSHLHFEMTKNGTSIDPLATLGNEKD